MFEKYFLQNGSAVKYHWHVCDRSQKKYSWLITKLFVIKQGLILCVVYHKTLCYFNVWMQEFFEINCEKGCNCDNCLWLIVEVCDKSQKFQSFKFTNLVTSATTNVNLCGPGQPGFGLAAIGILVLQWILNCFAQLCAIEKSTPDQKHSMHIV